MRYIVFDFEATCWPVKPAGYVQETIEVGAYALSGTGEYLGDFQRFVRPHYHPRLSPFCRELTHIEQRDVDAAGDFASVIDEFLSFIGYFDARNDYLLCAWGDWDFRHLRRECREHGLDDEWLEPHINLKEQYRRIVGAGKPIGLARAVRREGYAWEGYHARVPKSAFGGHAAVGF